MPTPPIKRSERRRCVKACDRCKRRKERCDGVRPCGRCRARGFGHDCSFAQGPPATISPVATSDRTSSSNRRNEHESDPGRSFHNPLSPGSLSIDLLDHLRPPGESSLPLSDLHSFKVAPVPQQSRLIHDCHGKLVFIGNAANLSFLHDIRHLIRDSIDRCPTADELPPGDDPLRHVRAETTPRSPSASDWVHDMIHKPPKRPDLVETKFLVWWYLRATDCVVHLFDRPKLLRELSHWLQIDQDGQQEDPGISAIFFLVLAIGAQACPENKDTIAEKYFNYGRFLTLSRIMEEPAVSAIQANILIATYLLGASRPDAASMYLGAAVRAAYALGIHRIDINRYFDSSEYILRERLWKTLRVLDLFLSASLGRSPSTHETRDTGAEADYSASADLCTIFEVILTQVYSQPKVSTDALDRISQYHRQWVARYSRGLAIDAIQPGEVTTIGEGKTAPNIGFHHLIEAYYWTTMLITRPSLIEYISRHMSKTRVYTGSNDATSPSSVQALAYACVHSAVRTADLLCGLVSAEGVPKRLPFVVNCSFVAAMVLGLAHFGDLDRTFPLRDHLVTSRTVLLRFSHHDAVAKSNLAIVDDLQVACDLYLEKRERRKMERQSLLFSGLFGTVGDIRQGLSSVGSNFLDSVGPEAQRWIELGNELSDMIPGLGGLSDHIMPISPRLLMFDSLEDLPSIPDMDTGTLSIGEWLAGDSVVSNTES
ncbi:hypothetical protein B0T10DRAFT_575313 [Thelonectria olida]|uniref:Zn(2)-C6 fungal-type domain-containing protein n=1 Tax=Thelonectria olida TaxID=1576542 RepID=A0A9P8W1X4_9HYPO|nr:hypothetical protein B0T10DRAFT_575313 [Thelonectria olida]